MKSTYSHDIKLLIDAKLSGQPIELKSMQTAAQVQTRSKIENPANAFIQTRSKARQRPSQSSKTLLKFNEVKLPSDDEEDEEFHPSGKQIPGYKN